MGRVDCGDCGLVAKTLIHGLRHITSCIARTYMSTTMKVSSYLEKIDMLAAGEYDISQGRYDGVKFDAIDELALAANDAIRDGSVTIGECVKFVVEMIEPVVEKSGGDKGGGGKLKCGGDVGEIIRVAAVGLDNLVPLLASMVRPDYVEYVGRLRDVVSRIYAGVET